MNVSLNIILNRILLNKILISFCSGYLCLIYILKEEKTLLSQSAIWLNIKSPLVAEINFILNKKPFCLFSVMCPRHHIFSGSCNAQLILS